MSKKIILNNDQLNLSLDRLACQLTENHDDFKDTVLADDIVSAPSVSES